MALKKKVSDFFESILRFGRENRVKFLMVLLIVAIVMIGTNYLPTLNTSGLGTKLKDQYKKISFPKPGYETKNTLGKRSEYIYTSEKVPLEKMTPEELRKMKANTEIPRYNKVEYEISDVNLSGKSPNEVIDGHATNLLWSKKYAWAMADYFTRHPLMGKGQIVSETTRVVKEIVSALSPILGDIDGTLAMSNYLKELDGIVESNRGGIDGLWPEHHSPPFIQLEMRIEQNDKRVSYTFSSDQNNDYNLTIATPSGTMNGAQAERVTKGIAVRYSTNPGLYDIYVDADLFDFKMNKDGSRPVMFTPVYVKLYFKDAINWLKTMFWLKDDVIAALMKTEIADVKSALRGGGNNEKA